MKRISKAEQAELKKAILAARAERSKHPAAFRPDSSQQQRLQKGRRAAEEMVSSFLREAGLDRMKFEALQEKRSVELERMIAKHKSDALRLASRREDTLHSSIAKQSEALRELASRPDLFLNPLFSLDTPFLIWTDPLLPMDSAVVQSGSWAKLRIATSERRGTPTVSFYFYWMSPYSDFALIDATAYLSASGHLRAHAPWTYWGVNTSSVEAIALFGIWFGLPHGAESTPYTALYLGATGAYGSTVSGGDVEATSISESVVLSKSMFAVPPGSLVVFEVAVAISYDNDDGNIEADFERGAFRISCPLVAFSLWNSPPTA